MGSKDLNITRDEMLDDMAKLLAPFEVDSLWFTSQEMAKRWEVTDQGARMRLEQKEREGEVIKHTDPVSKRVYYEKVVKDD